MAIEIFFDCGAPSLYNELSRKERNSHVMGTHMRNWHKDDFSYVESAEYLAYRRKYLEHLRREQSHLTACSNLDVIHNAELTWKNQQWFERRGVKPLPVFHLGSDLKWLRQYISLGYPYICLGGLVPNPPVVLKPLLDRLWVEELTDNRGMPKVKVHGFGMTSFDLMYRYPWYSVDSKTWVDIARFGAIYVPRKLPNGESDWLHPVVIPVSSRRDHVKLSGRHFKSLPKTSKEFVLGHLKDFSLPFGQSQFFTAGADYELQTGETWSKKPKRDSKGEVERVLEPGVSNDVVCRLSFNMHIFNQIERRIRPWPWSVHLTVRKTRSGGLQ